MEAYQVIVVSLIGSVIVWVLKQLAERTGKKIPDAVLTVGLYVMSFGLAVAWSVVKIPPLPPFTGDVAQDVPIFFTWFVNDLMFIIGGYVAFATLIYQAFVKYLLEHGIPLGVRAVIARVRS